jgi:hypothetical protein
MSANDQRGVRRTRDQEMAASLKARGIFHGVHQTKTNAPPIPNMKDVGSAAYRRLRKA